MTTKARVRGAGAVVVLALLFHWPARGVAQPAGDVDRAKESFKAGATAYAAGEYLAAIQALDTAYALTPLAPIAFSLAQAHRRQYFASHERLHLDQAIALFRRYVAEVPSGGRRADALDALSQLEPLAAVAGMAPAAELGGARPTRLLVTAEPATAQLSLDGSAPAPSPLIREVEAGVHRVTASAPGFFPLERQVTAVAGELVPITLALRERPGNVEVSAPPGAELYVDGAFAGRGGERINLNLVRGEHQVVVVQTGHRVFAHALELAPGEERRIQVTLEPTRTRQVSTALLIGSGAAALAAALSAGLALDAQVDAENFLKERARGNVSAAELAAYDEAVTHRNRYRVVAGVGIAAAIALAGAGVLLRELDRPDPKDLFRPGRPRTDGAVQPRVDPEPPRVQLTPVLSPGAAGVALTRAF